TQLGVQPRARLSYALTRPAARYRDLDSRKPGGPAPKHTSSDNTAATACLPQWNVEPSTHMRCSTVASLRARATLARFRPRRLATSRAQRFRPENRVARLSMIWAGLVTGNRDRAGVIGRV